MVRRANTEKMSVTIPTKLAEEIRSIVPQGSVSSFFAEALEHYLAYHRQRIALEKGFGAWKDENHPDLNTPEDTVQYVNSIREPDNKRFARLEDIVAE